MAISDMKKLCMNFMYCTKMSLLTLFFENVLNFFLWSSRVCVDAPLPMMQFCSIKPLLS